MIKVKKNGVLLTPGQNNFDAHSVLNPAVWQEGEKIHLIYRAINPDGISSLGYAELDGPLKIAARWDKPFIEQNSREEKKGVEDPRLVRIDGTFYLTYVAHDGFNAVSGLRLGPDLFNLKKNGIISPKIRYRDAGKLFSYTKLKDDYYFFASFYERYSGRNILVWHKDMIFFPEKINGQFVLLQRILPDIQLLRFDDPSQLKDKYFWLYQLIHLSENVILEGEHGFENRNIGGGAVPIKTKDGWLVIYHGVQENNRKRIYSAGAALFNLADPSRLIARLPYPLFSPTEDYELVGTVNNVVFPTGTALFGDDLYIYYGAADKYIATAVVSFSGLLAEILKHRRA